MNIEKTVLGGFLVGHGAADAKSKSLTAPGYSPVAFRGVKVRAASDNTISIYVGPNGVTPATGYELPKGEEIEIPVNPSGVGVVAAPAANSIQTLTLTGGTDGDTFTLSLDGNATADLAYDIAGADLQAAMQLVAAMGDVTVVGDGPYAIEFTGVLAKRDVDLLVYTPSADQTATVTETLASAGSQYSWIAA